MKSLKGFLLGLTILACMASGVQAAIITLANVGGAPLGVNYVNFDDLPLGDNGGLAQATGVDPGLGFVQITTTPNAQVVQGPNLNGIYASPFISNSNGLPFGDATVSGQDTTKYISAGTSEVSIQFGEDLHYVGMLWGSVDLYNTLEFYDNGLLVDSITGADVTAGANGDQGVNGTFYVNLLKFDGVFDEIRAKSSQFAFEFDNVAFNPTIPEELGGDPTVPEPATLAIWSAFAAIGLVIRRINR